MGYTHYWRREKTIDAETFRKIKGDFEKLLPLFKTLDIPLANGMGEGEPEITDDLVRFNGSVNCGHIKTERFGIAWPSSKTKFGTAPDSNAAIDGAWFAGATLNQRACDGDCSHETLSFPRKLKPLDFQKPNEEGKYFDFTKTAFKPYDLAVTAFLVIVKHYLGDRIKVSSDGKMEHWLDAAKICQNAFGYGLEDFRLN